MGQTGAKTFKRFLNASTSKEMHESQGSLSYKQTPKSSKISEFQTISNNFTKTIKNRLNFVGFCLGVLMEDGVLELNSFCCGKIVFNGGMICYVGKIRLNLKPNLTLLRINPFCKFLANFFGLKL